jgi:hypothetical protein
MTHYNKPQGLESVLYSELSEKRQRLSEFHPANMQMANSGSMSSSSGIPGAGTSFCCFYSSYLFSFPTKQKQKNFSLFYVQANKYILFLEIKKIDVFLVILSRVE